MGAAAHVERRSLTAQSHSDVPVNLQVGVEPELGMTESMAEV